MRSSRVRSWWTHARRDPRRSEGLMPTVPADCCSLLIQVVPFSTRPIITTSEVAEICIRQPGLSYFIEISDTCHLVRVNDCPGFRSSVTGFRSSVTYTSEGKLELCRVEVGVHDVNRTHNRKRDRAALCLLYGLTAPAALGLYRCFDKLVMLEATAVQGTVTPNDACCARGIDAGGRRARARRGVGCAGVGAHAELD